MIEFLSPVLIIFSLRIVDISFYTIRILMVMRGRKGLAWIFAFFQASVYVIALRFVLSDLGNWGKTLGYAAGFATGLVVGMAIEERLAIGYSHLRIISSLARGRISRRFTHRWLRRDRGFWARHGRYGNPAQPRRAAPQGPGDPPDR